MARAPWMASMGALRPQAPVVSHKPYSGRPPYTGHLSTRRSSASAVWTGKILPMLETSRHRSSSRADHRARAPLARSPPAEEPSPAQGCPPRSSPSGAENPAISAARIAARRRLVIRGEPLRARPKSACALPAQRSETRPRRYRRVGDPPAMLLDEPVHNLTRGAQGAQCPASSRLNKAAVARDVSGKDRCQTPFDPCFLLGRHRLPLPLGHRAAEGGGVQGSGETARASYRVDAPKGCTVLQGEALCEKMRDGNVPDAGC